MKWELLVYGLKDRNILRIHFQTSIFHRKQRFSRKRKKWLDVYFSGEEPKFTPPLHPDGSTFRQAVWKILLQIPYGQTITYGEIARKMAEMKNVSRMSAQAVGGAVGHNEISIIIPCHRVIGTNGSLTGYAGGIDRKLSLLELEHADMSYLFVPKKGTAL